MKKRGMLHKNNELSLSYYKMLQSTCNKNTSQYQVDKSDAIIKNYKIVKSSH